ncbi:MAG: Glycosyltransferase [Candidatus Magasanikbacteria bacterium GW2011_GWC2_37_14]|uniref:Glycosyltransferase n=1 Tax=Candidatus Magasanikbacteria bacterium GW2011_GWC2_37_14 TaxID=1619046 RepID=A0A0G0JIY8_9BACT|nr:MAG: Glycosyltransferase [Candidatus Magasanikbacteria bacterium GW2011_GWC2_37_14]
MKIIIGADTYYPNIDGASYFTQRLAEQLVLRGHEVLVIAPGKSFNDIYSTHNQVNILGVSSWPSGFHKDYCFSLPFGLLKHLEPVVLNFKPDVIHVQGHFFVENALIQIAKKNHLPIVATNHFMPDNLTHYVALPKKIKKLLNNLLWWHFKRNFSKLPIITTPTKTAANVLKKIGLTQEIIPLSCGIDMKKFNPNNNSDYLKKRHNLPNKPTILVVNRLSPEKHVDTVLRAVAELKKNIDIHFIVAGNGNERQNLENLAKNLNISNNVTFLGYVSDEDLPFVYPLANIFVMAGTAELQSLVTMEAMATSLPVVAANALALPELVYPNENGFLFNDNNYLELANYLKQLLENSDLRQKFGQESLEIIKKHDVSTTILAFEKLYQEAQTNHF